MQPDTMYCASCRKKTWVPANYTILANGTFVKKDGGEGPLINEYYESKIPKNKLFRGDPDELMQRRNAMLKGEELPACQTMCGRKVKD